MAGICAGRHEPGRVTRRGPVLPVLTANVLVLVAALALVATSGWRGGAVADTKERAVTAPSTTVPATTTTSAPPTTTTTTTAAPALPGDEPDGDTPVAPATASRRPGSSGREPSALVVTGTIEIPKIGLTHTTYEGISLAFIDYGPSHWPGTPLPGQAGNTVFAGHRVTHSHPFLDIDRIAVGDQVIFTNPSGRHVYEVTQTLVVEANDISIVDPTPGATFTIFACHPKHSARQRYVVKGRLVSSTGPTAAAGQPLAGGGGAPVPTTPTTSPLCLLCPLLGK